MKKFLSAAFAAVMINDHSSKLDQYNKLNSINADSGKMLALTECGCTRP